MKSPICLIATAIFYLSVVCPTQAGDASPQNIIFIMDASGSMWGRLGAGTKIEAARVTMDKLIVKLPKDTRVGLVAYGHRSASDCNDIETLVPLNTIDKTFFMTQVKSLNPKGKTPIASSIKHALSLVKEINEPVTIIILTDGLETCTGNACNMVKVAKASGAEITTHLVGLDIPDKDLSSLECIAQAGGGQYIPANNIDELIAALEKTVEKEYMGDAFISIKTMLDGKLLDATVRIIKKGDPIEIAGARTYAGVETNPRLLQIPEGLYDVIVEAVTIRSRPTQVFENVSVKSNDTIYQEVSFDQGQVDYKITRNGELSDATINFYKAGTKEYVTGSRSYKAATSNPIHFKLPPGLYDIEIKGLEISGTPIVNTTNVIVKSGMTTTYMHDFVSGTLSIGAKHTQGYIDATINVVDLHSSTSVGAGRTYQSTASNPKKFVLLPGKYRVDLNPIKPAGLTKKSITVEIIASGNLEKIIEW